ncbi:hypothetical protein NUW54_g473 [Trametes sanguinea]|uniref:Uncharacterized protein n=1 Tax=Trametes sanguinea TaxID=158606 RepID=A0ACC1QCZ3_9APHY|nr:hypothetical protein NUW54_g473 [Trametes sanguinea]
MAKKRKRSPGPVFKPLQSGKSTSANPGRSSVPRAGTSTSATRNFVVQAISQGRLGGRKKDNTTQSTIDMENLGTHDADCPRDTEGGASVIDTSSASGDASAAHHHCQEQAPSFDEADTGNRLRKDQRAAERVRSWVPYRQEYLDEILRHYGRKGFDFSSCSLCKQGNAYFRCLDCRIAQPLCQNCLLTAHREVILHRPEWWNGAFFEKVSLSSLGLVVPLGHEGHSCADPSTSHEIVVYHVNGYHRVQITLCTCTGTTSGPLQVWKQYLRAGWFPATTTRPSTAFTFELLELFHHLTLQSKVNAYDFFLTLGRLTDHSGLSDHPSRYKQFCHVVRLWRHLQQLKWAGRGHDPAGVEATQAGSLAVQCAACPHPGKNLPDGWELSPPEIIWLYTLFLMMDANFRQRCKDRGLDDEDLAPGWSFLVNTKKFQEHIDRTAGRGVENNTCSAEHNAILKAHLRKDGYVASGIGAVLCARHAMYRANGVGDLHLGEKFCYMDFLLVSTLWGAALYLVLVSYDIACQYRKNFFKRLREDFPPDMRADLEDVHIRWAIPKNHIAVHGPNHSHLSLNNLSGVGRVYGEGIESSWSSLNPVSMSTREMALATRHEVLNDHLNAWNWQKTIDFEHFLCKSLKHAIKMSAKQRELFNEFNATFPPEVVKEWERLLEIWNINPSSVPDPFAEPEANIKVNSVRLQFAQEEAQDLATALNIPQYINHSPSTFIQLGLELEEQQYVYLAVLTPFTQD